MDLPLCLCWDVQSLITIIILLIISIHVEDLFSFVDFLTFKSPNWLPLSCWLPKWVTHQRLRFAVYCCLKLDTAISRNRMTYNSCVSTSTHTFSSLFLSICNFENSWFETSGHSLFFLDHHLLTSFPFFLPTMMNHTMISIANILNILAPFFPLYPL